MKIKTHKGLAKRVKVSGSGKISHLKCGSRHLRTNKNKAQKALQYGKTFTEGHEARLIKLLP